jgi:2-keto-3-deoxy-L-rhamnonate aldolase RhmA
MANTRALKVGHFLVEFATPGIGHILKAAGCEFVILDTEHSGFSYETARSVAQYTRAADLPLIVRVPSQEYHHIARAADIGAAGIMLPMINSATEAQHVINCLKYPPKGSRGAIFQFAHDDYQPGTPKSKTRQANQELIFVAQIETAEGVANVDDIAAVDGVDVLWVGHFDLSNSLGIPGQFDHKKFTDATKAVIKAADKHGKSAGRLTPSVEESIGLYKEGFDFVSYSGDVWAYLQAIQSAVSDIRKGCAAVSKRRIKQEKTKKKPRKIRSRK